MKKKQLLGPQHEAAIAFLNAIYRDNNALGFWDLISSEAQGFFKGLWYGKGIFTLEQLKEISPENFFIKEQLNDILACIRHVWDIDINEYDVSNKVTYEDQFHVKINFVHNPGQTLITETPTVVKAVFVPLVYELTAEMEGRNPVWKVDYLKLNFFIAGKVSS